MIDKRFKSMDWDNPLFRVLIVFIICLGAFFIWEYRLPQDIDRVIYPSEHAAYGEESVHDQVNKWTLYRIYVFGLILTSISESWKAVFMIFAIYPMILLLAYFCFGYLPM
jgi:hypothetical protein